MTSSINQSGGERGKSSEDREQRQPLSRLKIIGGCALGLGIGAFSIYGGAIRPWEPVREVRAVPSIDPANDCTFSDETITPQVGQVWGDFIEPEDIRVQVAGDTALEDTDRNRAKQFGVLDVAKYLQRAQPLIANTPAKLIDECTVHVNFEK